MRYLMTGATCALVMAGQSALAGTAMDGYEWLSENTEVLREGVLWNDRFGDGKDRYKSGGITQSWVIPEGRIGDARWFEGHASAFELQVRGYVATPDNTSTGGQPGDRPFAQYVGIGGHLRTIGRPERIAPRTTQSLETRVGLEIGWQGDPLPIFELQDMFHGSGSVQVNQGNSIDGEFLANLEGRRTLRIHRDMQGADLQIAPFIQASAGMRETSIRAGADLIYGSDLDGWTWNADPAMGALIPGGSRPKSGAYWMVWLGADAGYVAADAFLDGGFRGNGPSVDREDLTARLRAGLLYGYDEFAVGYSFNWLSEEFSQQAEGQIIGAITVKYNF